MNKGLNSIGNGSKVAIVGGGPTGSLFAQFVLHYAGIRGIHPEITIYQQRNLDEPGPMGCKGCAWHIVAMTPPTVLPSPIYLKSYSTSMHNFWKQGAL